MCRKILITAAMALAGAGAYAQSSIERVLAGVEANNLTLDARSALSEAGALEARMGNSLPDPALEYEYVWGSRPELGKKGEFTAVQAFDFPSAYATRGRLARLRAGQYGSEYALYRQQVLSEAEALCIGIIALRRERALLDRRLDLARELSGASERKLEAGEVDVLHASQARVRYLSAENQARLLDVEIADAIGRLKILNGGIEPDFTDTEFPAITAIMSFGEMLDIYMESDPALLGALAGRDVARQGVKVARSESLPKLELGYALEYGGGEQFHGVVAGMSIPMFGNRHNVKRARAEERYASLEADDARARTERTLATLYDKAALLEESIRSYGEITHDTDEYLAGLGKSLDAGQITITDYFSQYDGIIAFEEALTDLVKEYHLVRAQIYSVML